MAAITGKRNYENSNKVSQRTDYTKLLSIFKSSCENGWKLGRAQMPFYLFMARVTVDFHCKWLFKQLSFTTINTGIAKLMWIAMN
jgi:hypothetical protein